MGPAFRKEFSDLRQQEIQSAAQQTVARDAGHGRFTIRVLDASARGLYRIARRLDQAALLSRERDRALIRRP